MDKTELTKHAEARYPYLFMAEKSTIDAIRKGFIEGYMYKADNKVAAKKITSITRNEVCEIARIIYDKDTIFICTELIRSSNAVAFRLTGTTLKTSLWLSFDDMGEFYLTKGEGYESAIEIGMNTKAIYEAYKKLEEFGYEINF